MRGWLGLLLLGTALVACRQGSAPAPEDDAPAWLVLGQVPAAARVSDATEWVLPGSRVVRVDAEHPDRPPLVLSQGFHAAGEPAVQFDGKRVCFVGRKKPNDPWGLYTCSIEGSPPERIATTRKSCASPAWLPDGRVAYCADGDPSPYRELDVAAVELYVAGADGGPSDRITFSNTIALDPAVLSDGRIVYAGWHAGTSEYPDARSLALFTVHPDGSGLTLFHGGTDAAFHRRPRQAPDGTVYCLHTSGQEPVRIGLADWRAPLEPCRVLEGPMAVVAVEPATDGTLWVVTEDPTTGRTSLSHCKADGSVLDASPFADPAGTVVGVDARPRPKPQGHLSMIDVRKEYGSLLAIDTQGEDVQGAVAVRLKRWVREFDDEPATLETLGELPLEEDGSFFVRVPPDVPLRVELLDEEGRALDWSRTPFWVRPNEIRGCTGCHDPADKTPPNRRPMAVAHDPVFLRGEDGDGR